MLNKLLAFTLALTLIGAGLAKAAEKKAYLGICIHSTDNEIWNQMAEGAAMFAASLSPGAAEVQILSCYGDEERQISGIKAFIASHGQDAMLFVDPANAPNTAVIAELCEEAGVYWTSGFHLAKGLKPMDYKYYVTHQSVDSVKMGYDIAVKLFNALPTPGRGTILALQGMLGNDSAVERYRGFQKALSEYPGITLLDMQVCDWNPQKALATTETWLAKYPDVDGIWSANDLMALGAIQALKAKGLNGKVKVVGVDGISGALEAIASGDMVCTVANNGYMQGGYGIAFAHAAWSGKIDTATAPRKYRGFNSNVLVVSKDNLDQYIANNVKTPPKFDFTNLDYPIASEFVFEE